MDKLRMQTANKADENFRKLAAMFPNAVTETINENGEVVRAIDKDVLMQEISCTVVDGNEERYQFTWPDKKKSVLLANAPINKTLRPVREDESVPTGADSAGKPYCSSGSVNFDTTENLYIEGDNLEVLKLLQETYLGKIKMIYIDPPYNTGNDFVYEDDFAQSAAYYMDNSGQYDEEGNLLVTNTESNGRFHTDWLNMMYPRLKIAKDLLADDGAIFISIDHNEHANLKEVCDLTFGVQCFIAELAWKSSDNSNNNALTFSEDYNTILVYAKNPDWKPHFLNDPKKRSHFKNPDNDPRGPWFDGNPVNNPGLRPNLQFNITSPSGKVIKHPANGWRWSKETIAEKLKTGELRFSEDETRLIRRTYLADMEGLPPSTLCVDLEVTGHTRGAKYELKKLFPEYPVTDLFSTPKPTLLIKYLLTLGTDKDSLVMDFFSGSGTTADAVMQLNAEEAGNRKFILVQLAEPCTGNTSFSNICEMGKERIRRAGRKIKEDAGLTAPADLDIGFRCLRLDSSNMENVYYTPEETQQQDLFSLVDNVKPDRTPEDLLFQVMLDLGVLLSSPIEVKEIAGKKVFNVADGFLLACFDHDVTEETVKDIAQMKPYYAVFRDSSMANDSVATNFDQIFETYSPETVRKVL